LEDDLDFILVYLSPKELFIKLSVQNTTVDASTLNNPACLSVFIRFWCMLSCSGSVKKNSKTKQNAKKSAFKQKFV